MSVSELTSSLFPRYSWKRLVKSVRRLRRQTKTQTTQWYRRQYFLSDAARDVRVSASRNEDIFLGSLMAVVLLSYAFVATASQVMYFSFQSITAVSDATGISLTELTLLCFGVLGTTTAWFLGFIINMLSLTLLDGANRKRNVSLKHTMREALRLSPAFTVMWFSVLTIAAAAFITIALPFAVYGLGHYKHALPSIGFDAAALTALLVVGYQLSSIVLAPTIVLTEPKVAVLAALQTSRRLLPLRGRLFVMALGAIVGTALAASWELSLATQHAFGYQGDILFYLLAVVEVIAANLVLTVLYRKRRQARTSLKQPRALHLRFPKLALRHQ